MSSEKSSQSQQVCWSIRESMSSIKNPWSQGVFDQLWSQWALIRALDHSLVVGQSESQCCLLELLIVRCLWSIRESIVSDKNSRSQHVCWWMREWIYSRKSSLSQEVFAQSGSQWALIRAPDHNLVAGRSGNQCALKRAPDRKKFLINQGVYELW